LPDCETADSEFTVEPLVKKRQPMTSSILSPSQKLSGVQVPTHRQQGLRDWINQHSAALPAPRRTGDGWRTSRALSTPTDDRNQPTVKKPVWLEDFCLGALLLLALLFWARLGLAALEIYPLF